MVQWLWSLYCPPPAPPSTGSSSVFCVVKDPCPSCTCLPLKTEVFILPCPWGLGWHGVSLAMGLLGTTEAATELVQTVGGTTGSGTLEPAGPMAPASLPGVLLISPGAALLNA